MPKKLDFFANIAIVLIALLFGSTLIHRFISRRHEASLASSSVNNNLETGKLAVSPVGYEWTHHERTILLVLKYGCIHCERNMSLYRRLFDLARSNTIGPYLLSVFPDDEFVAQHDLDTHSLKGMPFIANADFGKLHIIGTPTILLVDSKGRILHSWLGELSQQQQNEVVESVMK